MAPATIIAARLGSDMGTVAATTAPPCSPIPVITSGRTATRKNNRMHCTTATAAMSAL